MKKRTKITFAVIAVILTGSYLGLWGYSAQWFQKEIDRAYADKTDNVEFLGDKPRITNFPFIPKVLYSGGLKVSDAEILFPQVQLKGYPLPGTALKVDFPLGIALGGITNPKVWHLDALKTSITIPYSLPEDFTFEGLSAWRDGGGQITVRHYEMMKGALQSNGKGHLFLDEQLQPDLNFESEIRGYQKFIADQRDADLIEPFAAAIGETILNGIAKPDSKTGESVVNVTVTVKNGILSAGPIQALELPPIVWGRRN